MFALDEPLEVYQSRPAPLLRPTRIVLAKGSNRTAGQRRFTKRICAAYPAAEVVEAFGTPHNRVDLGESDPLRLHEQGKQTLVLGEHRSAVRFSDEGGNACPNYWHFSPYGFCPYGCHYCYLAGTPGVWFSPTVKIFLNLEEILAEVNRTASQLGRPTAFYLGKLQDGLALEPLSGYARTMVPFFAQHPYARMVILTKSAEVENLLDLDHAGRSILSWTVNAPEVARLFEKNTPDVIGRLDAMRQCAQAGYPVRAVLMPIIPVDDWQALYGVFLAALLESVPLSRITLGSVCSYPVGQRTPFVQAYFALLQRCLEGHARGDVDLPVLAKVVGFEIFPVSCHQGQLAAGMFNIRNPAYLLSRVALPKAPEDPKFLPLICPPSSPAESSRLFCHYRRIGILGGRQAQLFVYPPVDARDRSSSYRLIAELFASLTPKDDPWVQERIRLLFDGVFADLVAPLQDNRIQLLDVACGTARMTMGLCRRAFAKYGTSFDLTLVDVVRGAPSIATTFYRHPRAFGNIVFRHESLFEWIDGISGSPARFDLVLMLRICDVFSRFQIEELSCREARDLIQRERGQSSVDSDTTEPARLIEENSLDKLHHRLCRSPFRGGMVFHQFSLSDYFRAIKIVLDGGASGVEGMIYAPIRRFDETALVLPSGRSLIGQLMTMANKILIEDSDLTASRLQRHINHFGLSDLSVTDFTDRRGRHGASVVVIGRRQSLRERIATAEMTAASEIGAWHQQDEEGGSS